jgi:hypothetical protein
VKENSKIVDYIDYNKNKNKCFHSKWDFEYQFHNDKYEFCEKCGDGATFNVQKIKDDGKRRAAIFLQRTVRNWLGKKRKRGSGTTHSGIRKKRRKA